MSTRRKPVRREVIAPLPEPPPFSSVWPHLAWLLAYGGKYTIGPEQEHLVAAVAYNSAGAVGSVVLRARESMPELLARLNEAVGRLETKGGLETPINEADMPLTGLARRPGR